MQNGPILILKNMSKPNYLANCPSPQVKSVELSSHSSTEATVEGPAQLDVVNVGYCGKRKGKGLAQAPDASAHTAPKTPSKTSILTSKPGQPGVVSKILIRPQTYQIWAVGQLMVSTTKLILQPHIYMSISGITYLYQ